MVKRRGNITKKVVKLSVEIAKALFKASVFIAKWLHRNSKYPILSVPLVGTLSGVFLFFFHGTEYATLFIITIIAWLASDFLTPYIIAGGKGIFQFKINNTRTIAEGYGFLTFFGVILGLSIGINFLSDNITQMLSNSLSDFIVAWLVGLVLSALIFADLYLKFYKHEK